MGCLATLINLKSKYKNDNLYINIKRIILKSLPNNQSLVLFFNDKMIGNYAVVVDNCDLKIEDCKMPIDFINELKITDKLKELKLTKKQAFKKLDLKECDFVELLVEKDEYIKSGIHKEETGVVAIDYSIDDYVLVDFSEIDEDGNYYGDCIEVKINDLKKLN